ncbi:MAG TPA: glycyl-radical enzyme activating protein [Anaerolineae bacterium]|nr:glycyl-radical enzyme activating protein [Anaerolineae bacterium]
MDERAEDPDNGAEPTGAVFEIQRWSGNDGPGIRTVVFFKGCPLRCAWCCNPESWSPAPQVAFFEERCLGCGRCREVCPRSIPGPGPDGGRGSAPGCTACGRCVKACPSGARVLMGKRMAVGEVLQAVERDRVFYRQSGGGVTFSGGEALAQPRFLAALAEGCQAAGLPMALETCGYFSWATSKEILAGMELIFFDIKHVDPAVHRRVTGVDNRLILENAVRIVRNKMPLVIRVPLIPAINDDVASITAIAAFMSERLGGALGVEVLPYHTLGKGKYGAIGLDYPLAGTVPPEPASVARARKIFQDLGVANLYFGSAPLAPDRDRGGAR